MDVDVVDIGGNTQCTDALIWGDWKELNCERTALLDDLEVDNLVLMGGFDMALVGIRLSVRVLFADKSVRVHLLPGTVMIVLDATHRHPYYENDMLGIYPVIHEGKVVISFLFNFFTSYYTDAILQLPPTNVTIRAYDIKVKGQLLCENTSISLFASQVEFETQNRLGARRLYLRHASTIKTGRLLDAFHYSVAEEVVLEGTATLYGRLMTITTEELRLWPDSKVVLTQGSNNVWRSSCSTGEGDSQDSNYGGSHGGSGGAVRAAPPAHGTLLWPQSCGGDTPTAYGGGSLVIRAKVVIIDGEGRALQ